MSAILANKKAIQKMDCPITQSRLTLSSSGDFQSGILMIMF